MALVVNFSVLSTFSGIGGLDLGFDAAGGESTGCVEFDPGARESLAANGLWELLAPADVLQFSATVRPRDLSLRKGELDVLIGGPPCQPFSSAAQWAKAGWKGMEDGRAAALYGLLELADSFRPRVVVLENVPGFVRGPRSALGVIQSEFNKINAAKGGARYRVHHAVVNAADYGVPQRRKRAIIVAVRCGKEFEWPRGTHIDRPVRAYDALRTVRANGDTPEPSGRWAGLLPSIPEGENYQWHSPGGGGEPLFGKRTRYWSFLLKLAKDQPAWTLPASPGPSTGPFHWDSRPLSTRELLRLQTFPVSWKVLGGYRSQVRQIGNATPPLLAEVMARAVGEQLFQAAYLKKPRFRIARAVNVPGAESAAAVPVSYLQLRGDHTPHPGTGLGPKPRTD